MNVHRVMAIVIALVLLMVSVGPAFAQTDSDGKQIVLMMGVQDLKFVSVTISGYNQYDQWSTWTQNDPRGSFMAYTKDWWWTENFVQISFTVLDLQGVQSTQICLIDALEQPVSVPRVVIVYTPEGGCAGGEAGSAQDPVWQALQPLRDAFVTIDYYLPDDKFDFMMHVVYNEMNSVGCVLGLSSVLYSKGLTMLDSTTRAYITKTCQSTGQQILSLFPSQ